MSIFNQSHDDFIAHSRHHSIVVEEVSRGPQQHRCIRFSAGLLGCAAFCLVLLCHGHFTAHMPTRCRVSREGEHRYTAPGRSMPESMRSSFISREFLSEHSPQDLRSRSDDRRVALSSRLFPISAYTAQEMPGTHYVKILALVIGRLSVFIFIGSRYSAMQTPSLMPSIYASTGALNTPGLIISFRRSRQRLPLCCWLRDFDDFLCLFRLIGFSMMID